jgi:hypothetical protein
MISMQSSSQVLNWRIMPTLIAKDWRLYRVHLIALLVTSAGCYALGLMGAFYRLPDPYGPRDSFYAASIIAANLTALLAAAFGGMAIAGERSDRTADFLSLLPVNFPKVKRLTRHGKKQGKNGPPGLSKQKHRRDFETRSAPSE